MGIEKLYTQIYKVAVLIRIGIVMPGEAFPLIGTGNAEYDDFFHNFWDKARQQDFAEKIVMECEALTAKNPDFVFVQHVIGLYLTFDFNAFHYALTEAAILYALVKTAEKEGVLNDAAVAYISSSTLAAAQEAPLSKLAFSRIEKYIKEIPAEYKRPANDFSSLFPAVTVESTILDNSLEEKIEQFRMDTGVDETPESIALQVGWYSSIIKAVS